MADRGGSTAHRIQAEVAGGNSGPSTSPGAERRAAYLLPGQLHAAAEPTAITTVLGSCVSVCLFDRAAGVGGMNHYLLPTYVERERSARFGNGAIELLLADVTALGARRARLEAKVFGGASVMGMVREGRRSLGDENARLAFRLLEALAIPVVDGDVGGTRGRKVVFHTDDGSAWMRLL